MKSKFNNLYKLIIQQLTQAQKQLTDTYTAKRAKNLSFGPFTSERLYFPVPKHQSIDLPIPQNISTELDKAGFYITDYRNGIALKKTINGQKADLRQVKIGKILNRLNKPELKKEFDERLSGNIKKVDKDLLICMTHNPYDIAGMSTGRNWTSCMNLDTGAFKNTPLIEVQYGGMCAYLIDKDDKEIQHPYARIAIKRLIDRVSLKYFIFLQEGAIYGDVAFAKEMHFDEQVSKILNKSNEYTSGDAMQFERDDGEWQAYSDSALNQAIYIKDIDKLKNDIQEEYIDIPSNDIFNKIAEKGKADFKFLMKYLNHFSNLGMIITYNTYTDEELDIILNEYAKIWQFQLGIKNQEQFDNWLNTVKRIYNKKHEK